MKNFLYPFPMEPIPATCKKFQVSSPAYKYEYNFPSFLFTRDYILYAFLNHVFYWCVTNTSIHSALKQFLILPHRLVG